MARETKVGLLVGVCVILLVGIIVSDHLSVVQHQSPAALTAWAPGVQNRLTQTNQDAPDPFGNPPQADRVYQPPAPIPAPNDTQGASDTARTPPDPTPRGAGNDAAVVPPNRPTPPTDPRLARGGQATTPQDNAGTATTPAIEVLDTHKVQHGDTLFKLAKAYYHHGDKWKVIALANPSVVDAAGHLKDGTALVIPKLADAATPTTDVPLDRPEAPRRLAMSSPPAGGTLANGGQAPHGEAGTPAGSVHFIVVQREDTLGKLAAHYLGSRSRWEEILNLNRDKLQSAGDLRIGMKLRLPDAHSAVTLPNQTALAMRRPPENHVTPTRNDQPDTGARTPPPTFDRPGTPWPTDARAPGNPVVPASRRQIIYTVQPSDSLQDIAAKTLGDSSKWPVILNANRQALAGQDHLQIGQRLVVPISPD